MRADHERDRRAEQGHDRDEQEPDSRDSLPARGLRQAGRRLRGVQEPAAQDLRAQSTAEHDSGRAHAALLPATATSRITERAARLRQPARLGRVQHSRRAAA